MPCGPDPDPAGSPGDLGWRRVRRVLIACALQGSARTLTSGGPRALGSAFGTPASTLMRRSLPGADLRLNIAPYGALFASCQPRRRPWAGTPGGPARAEDDRPAGERRG